MSTTTELLAEKLKSLSEPDARSVLEFVNRLTHHAPTPAELLRMPASEREQILSVQAASAEKLYRENPNLIVEDWDEPVTHA